MGGRLDRGAFATAMVVVLAACASGGDIVDVDQPATEGMSHLVENDLRTPPTEGHFTASPTQVSGQLVSLPNGCVAVVVDGVMRIPIWPDGTTIASDADDLDRYVVTLPGGTELVATSSDGDGFTADGEVDDSPEPFSDPGEPPGLVATYLGFCAVDAAPILFPDSTTFSRTQ